VDVDVEHESTVYVDTICGPPSKSFCQLGCSWCR